MAFDKGLDKEISFYAQKWGIDEKIARALVHKESTGNPKATSYVTNNGKFVRDKVGNKIPLAKGLTQLTDPILKQYKVTDPYDVRQNLDAGFHYLSDLTKRYGNEEEALIHYNGGGKAVEYFRKRGGPFHDPTMGRGTWANQTGDYVKSIMAQANRDVSHIPTTSVALASKRIPSQPTQFTGQEPSPIPTEQPQQIAQRSPLDVIKQVATSPANLLVQPAQAQEEQQPSLLTSPILSPQEQLERTKNPLQSFQDFSSRQEPEVATPATSLGTLSLPQREQAPVYNPIPDFPTPPDRSPTSLDSGVLPLFQGIIGDVQATGRNVFNFLKTPFSGVSKLTGGEGIASQDPLSVPVGRGQTLEEVQELHPFQTGAGRVISQVTGYEALRTVLETGLKLKRLPQAAVLGTVYGAIGLGGQIARREKEKEALGFEEPALGLEGFIPSNKAEIITEAGLSAAGPVFGPAIKAAGSAFKVLKEIGKQGPIVVPRAIHAIGRTFMDEARFAPLTQGEAALSKETGENIAKLLQAEDTVGGLKIKARKQLDTAKSQLQYADDLVKASFGNLETGKVAPRIIKTIDSLVEQYRKSVNLEKMVAKNLGPWDEAVLEKTQILDKIETYAEKLDAPPDVLKEIVTLKGRFGKEAEVVEDVLQSLRLANDGVAKTKELLNIQDFKRNYIGEGKDGTPNFYETWINRLQSLEQKSPEEGFKAAKEQFRNHLGLLQTEIDANLALARKYKHDDLIKLLAKEGERLLKAYQPDSIKTRNDLVKAFRDVGQVDKKLGDVYFRDIDKRLGTDSPFIKKMSIEYKNFNERVSNLYGRIEAAKNPTMLRRLMEKSINSTRGLLQILRAEKPAERLMEYVDNTTLGIHKWWSTNVAHPMDITRLARAGGLAGSDAVHSRLSNFAKLIRMETSLATDELRTTAAALAKDIKDTEQLANLYDIVDRHIPVKHMLDEANVSKYLANPQLLKEAFPLAFEKITPTPNLIRHLKARAVPIEEDRIASGILKGQETYVYHQYFEVANDYRLAEGGLNELMEKMGIDKILKGRIINETKKPWLEHRTGGDIKLVKDPFLMDEIRITNGIYKRNVDSLIKSLSEVVRSGNYHPDLDMPITSALMQVSGAVRKSDFTKAFLDPLENNLTRNLLNNPGFAALNLMQAIYPWAVFSKNADKFNKSIEVLANPAQLENVIAVFKKMGMYEGTAVSDLMKSIAAGDASKVLMVNKASEFFNQLKGGRTQKFINTWLNHPFIEGSEFMLATFTGVTALGEKYGNKLIPVINALRNPKANRFLWEEAGGVVFDAIDNYLFVKNPFNSLLGRESTIGRFSTFTGRSLALMYDWLQSDPRAFANALNALYIAGGPQAMIPIAQNINDIWRSLGNEGDIINVTDWIELENLGYKGELVGSAAVAGFINQFSPLGLAPRQALEFLGPFPLGKILLEGHEKIKSGELTPLDTVTFLAQAGTGKSWLGINPQTANKLFKQFFGDPTSKDPDKQQALGKLDTVTVYGTKNNKMEFHVGSLGEKASSFFRLDKQSLVQKRLVDSITFAQSLEAEVVRIKTNLDYAHQRGDWAEVETLERDLQKAQDTAALERARVIDVYSGYFDPDKLTAVLDEKLEVRREGIIQKYRKALEDEIGTIKLRLNTDLGSGKRYELIDRLSEIERAKRLLYKDSDAYEQSVKAGEKRRENILRFGR